MRRLAVLAVAAALAVPALVVAQSPNPDASPTTFRLCIEVEGGGPFGTPELLTSSIQNGWVKVVAVDVGCGAETPSPAPSSDIPALEATPAPTIEPTPRPTARPKPTPKPSYKKLGKRAWQKLVRSPDDHIGERVQVWACISQFDAATGSDSFRAQAWYKRTPYWWTDGDNVFFMGDADDLDDFVEDDAVWMNAMVVGAYSYDTTIGGSQTVPLLLVDKIKHKGSCE
jgi:hypothetical protein